MAQNWRTGPVARASGGMRVGSHASGPQLPAACFHYIERGLLAPFGAQGSALAPYPSRGPRPAPRSAGGPPSPQRFPPLPTVAPRHGGRGFGRAVVGGAPRPLPFGRLRYAPPPFFFGYAATPLLASGRFGCASVRVFQNVLKKWRTSLNEYSSPFLK